MPAPGFGVSPARIDVEVVDGQVLDFGGWRVEVRHVPGHCPGNVLFYFPASDAAFVGDAIFAEAVSLRMRTPPW